MTHTPHSTERQDAVDTDAIRALLEHVYDMPLRQQVMVLCNRYDELHAEHIAHHGYLESMRGHLFGIQAIIDRWAEEEGMVA